MGILNVTPDSFSDGGRFSSPDEAIHEGLRLAEAGADILDIGGESTRPGSAPVSAEDELQRVLPVILGIHASAPNVVLSIDTYKGSVAAEAVAAGADIINDVGAGNWDTSMLDVVSRLDAGYITMHSQGTPQTMQKNPHYEDVLTDVVSFLEEQITAWEKRGLDRERLALDPGIGFGKTVEHNLALLKNADKFSVFGRPVVWGISRKNFLRKFFEVDEVHGDLVTEVGHAWLLAHVPYGAIWRVHDVKRARHLADTGIPLERTPDFDQFLARIDNLK